VKDESIAIFVAFHEVSPYRALGEPFKEICNRSSFDLDVEGFEYYVERLDGLESPLGSWAEIAPLIKGGEMFPAAQYLGLQHYRRIFALDVDSGSSGIITTSYLDRYKLANHQIPAIQRLLNTVVIPLPEARPTNLYDDFKIHHKDLIDGLNAACEVFDSETALRFKSETAREYLKNTNQLHPYNMFLGPRDFYEEWRNLLLKIMHKLDEMRDQLPIAGPQKKWGGFIIERLFSAYMFQIIQEGKWEVAQKPIYFFTDPNEIINERLQAIETSNIWRLTFPLRKLGDILRTFNVKNK
jgi:hypothetical protein